LSRRICVALYDAIIQLRPDWHSDEDEAGAIKVVMTGAASDPPSWQPHIGKRLKSTSR
jgi:type I restriction enzyme R subunit